MVGLAETHINVEMRPAIAVEKKIGRHHIAFFRAILMGMDMGEMSDRYLETRMDSRRAKTTLVWIQDTLRQAALRRGNHRDAHLLRIRVLTSMPSERVWLSKSILLLAVGLLTPVLMASILPTIPRPSVTAI